VLDRALTSDPSNLKCLTLLAMASSIHLPCTSAAAANKKKKAISFEGTSDPTRDRKPIAEQVNPACAESAHAREWIGTRRS
jgi:hypothetical protein